MAINRALLKYGYSEFRLEILEYCEIDNTLIREDYYLENIKPEYNILKKAGSLLGFKHSEEVRAKMSESREGNTNSVGNKNTLGFKHSEESRAKMSEAKKGNKYSLGKQNSLGRILSDETKAKMSASAYKVKIEVLDIETGIKTVYSSMREAAIKMGVSISGVKMYFIQNTVKPYKGRYIMKKL